MLGGRKKQLLHTPVPPRAGLLAWERPPSTGGYRDQHIMASKALDPNFQATFTAFSLQISVSPTNVVITCHSQPFCRWLGLHFLAELFIHTSLY
jgi:hypothetical protein